MLNTRATHAEDARASARPPRPCTQDTRRAKGIGLVACVTLAVRVARRSSTASAATMMWPPVADDPTTPGRGLCQCGAYSSRNDGQQQALCYRPEHARARLRRGERVCAQRDTSSQLEHDDASFDRLSQTDLVGDEHAAVGRLKELANRLELIGLQVRARAELVERRPN